MTVNMASSLNMTVLGESGVGKSWLMGTMPAPRLILDAEGGSRFAPATEEEFATGVVDPAKKVLWDPRRDDPPAAGDWQTCVVLSRSLDVLDATYMWLSSGKHPFESVGLDQLPEMQARIKESLRGRDKLTSPDWDEVLRSMQDLTRKYRDLVHEDAARPLQAVLFASGVMLRDDKIRPMLQGQMRDQLPYFTDVVGHMKATVNEETKQVERRMLIQPMEPYVAKDRTHVLTRHYGPVIVNPNVTAMLAVLRGEVTVEPNEEG